MMIRNIELLFDDKIIIQYKQNVLKRWINQILKKFSVTHLHFDIQFNIKIVIGTQNIANYKYTLLLTDDEKCVEGTS